MKKKIHPKDQTEELNKAKVEFIKRNEKEFQQLKELLEKNNEGRDRFTTELSNHLGGGSPEYKAAWDFLLNEQFFDKELKDKIKEIEIPPAANATYPFECFGIDIANQVMMNGGDDIFHMSKDTRNEKYLDYLCQHAREIFAELTNGEPSSYLLVGIDLRRSKDVILNELENLPMLLNLTQIKAIATKMPEKRFKWLFIADQLYEVWDLYEQAGKQPARKTFRDVARITGRPLSTIKGQWRLAYEKIYGIPYEPGSKYSTEEKRGDADQLCARCPHGAKCYRGAEWKPCSDYLKIAGKEKNDDDLEYHDEIDYDEYLKHRHKKKTHDE